MHLETASRDGPAVPGRAKVEGFLLCEEVCGSRDTESFESPGLQKCALPRWKHIVASSFRIEGWGRAARVRQESELSVVCSVVVCWMCSR